MISNNDLKNFIGTENYFKMYMDLKITDGVKFFIDKCSCYWLISDIAVINKIDKAVLENRAKGNNFLIVDVKINRHPKAEEPKVIWTLKEDTNEPILYSQEYFFSDIDKYFSDDEIKFYLIDDVMLLTSEY